MTNAKNKMNRWTKYECEMFHTTIYLFVGERRDLISSMESFFRNNGMNDGCIEEMCEEICYRLPSEDGISEAGDYLCINTKHYGTIHLIRLERFEYGNIDDIMVLNHECLHAAIRHLNVLGIKEGVNSANECLCYFQEHIFRTFLISLHKGHLVRKN